MAFDDTCAQCAYLEILGENKGKYPCSNPRSGYKVVSARKRKCDVYCAIGVGKRTTRECRELEANSKKYGYFIVTAIHDILDLPVTDYMTSFVYIKEEYMPMVEGYESFLEEYEINGPYIADKLLEDDNREQIALSLLDDYLDEFKDLVFLERHEEACEVYIRMYDKLLLQYGKVSTRVKSKRKSSEF